MKHQARTRCTHHPHEGEPTGYVEWFAWAAEMSKTHTQKRCPHCRRFKLWVPKDSDK